MPGSTATGGVRMAKCEQGYLCEVCGADVEDLTGSDLYLRYVLGEVDPERLHRLPERHVRCNPALAQYMSSAFRAGAVRRFLRQGSARRGVGGRGGDTGDGRGWRRLQNCRDWIAHCRVPAARGARPLAATRRKLGRARFLPVGVAALTGNRSRRIFSLAIFCTPKLKAAVRMVSLRSAPACAPDGRRAASVAATSD